MDNRVLLCRHHHRLVHEGGYSVQMSDQGIPAFTDPAGCTIPQVVEKSLHGSVFALTRQNCETGLRITPETTVSLWEGEKMDMNMAIEGLLWRKSSPEQPTRPELDCVKPGHPHIGKKPYLNRGSFPIAQPRLAG